MLAVAEPRTGQRPCQVRARRTKRGAARFRQQPAARCSRATNIWPVRDGLSPHAASTFYDRLPAATAQRLADRFEGCHAPKCSSWPNRSELNFSTLGRQRLKRRVPARAQLARLAHCRRRERQAQGIGIHRQFTVTDARQALNSQWRKAEEANGKYQKTC